MAVPFHDVKNEDHLGLAAYLRFLEEAGGKGIRGGLFFVNARGEPAEFTFSRVEVTPSFLWRPGDQLRAAVAALSRSLFAAAHSQPAVLLSLADEVPQRVFIDDLNVNIPLCLVSLMKTDGEEPPTSAGHFQLIWVGDPPGPYAPARQLLQALQARGVTVEPFDRAAIGLVEAFSLEDG